MTQDDLTAKQINPATGLSKLAVFLPAISTFYSAYVGKQQSGDLKLMQPTNRIPAGFNNSVEGMNWFNDQLGYFTYKWSLYSAGHADLDLAKNNIKEAMTQRRDRNTTFLLGDSGGFQIAKGVWEGDWMNPNDPVTSKRRDTVLKWLDGCTDYAMGLDIPAWVVRQPGASAKINIHSYNDALLATQYNNEYFIKNRKGWRNGGTRFLNVLQGENHSDAEHWYQAMKKYCDPAQYPENHFDGWAMGGQNMCDVHLALMRLVHLKFDGLLESGVHDWVHFLGTSRLEWAVLLTDIQTAIRRYHNPTLTISFDCASPFLATANGQIYYEIATPPNGKWSYRMQRSVDNKKYAHDTRMMSDVFVNQEHFKVFEDSPISSRCQINDICVYAPGDLNKIGKEGRTSWDSFSYALQMGHNVWMHIEAVQRANAAYIAGLTPAGLMEETFETVSFTELVDQIFSAPTRETAIAIIDQHSAFWTGIGGSRGITGTRTINAQTQFNTLFDVCESVDDTNLLDGLSETDALDQLGHIGDKVD